MNKTLKNIFILLLIFISFMTDITYKKAFASTNTTSEIVMDATTNRVLYEKNAFEKKYMASTTKILTALCVIENTNLEEKIVIPKEAVGIEGSSIYLKEGEILSVKDLLYGLMLRSGNDSAVALALHTSGSLEKFALLMNETARKIGAFNSNFITPHGLHNDNHYTTAYDLALISSYAINNPTFKQICSTKKITIPYTINNTCRLLINKNKLLNSLEGATGIKTGYTKKAGRCLVASKCIDGHEIVSVVLNCNPMFERSTELLNNAFNNYKFEKVIEKDNILGFIDIKNSKEKCAFSVKNDIFVPINEKELKNVSIKYEVPSLIEKSVNKNIPIGKLSVFIENNLIFEEKLYSIVDINL